MPPRQLLRQRAEQISPIKEKQRPSLPRLAVIPRRANHLRTSPDELRAESKEESSNPVVFKSTDKCLAHSFFKDEKLMRYVEKKYKLQSRHLKPQLAPVETLHREKQVRSVNEFLVEMEDDSEDEVVFKASNPHSPWRLRDIKDKDF